MDGWDKVYKIIVDRDQYKEDLETALSEIDRLKEYIFDLQSEIDVTYGKAFVAGKKNGEQTMQDEIDELVEMLETYMLEDAVGQCVTVETMRKAKSLITKHKHKGE